MQMRRIKLMAMTRITMKKKANLKKSPAEA